MRHVPESVECPCSFDLPLTNPTVQELLEMQYQFAEPFIVDSSKITNALHVEATPIRAGLGRDTRHLRSKDSTSSALTLPLALVEHSAHAASTISSMWA